MNHDNGNTANKSIEVIQLSCKLIRQSILDNRRGHITDEVMYANLKRYMLRINQHARKIKYQFGIQ